MKEREATAKLPAILGALLALGACTPGDPVTGPAEVAVQILPVRVPTTGGETGQPRILVDASRDGGVWWFPQAAPFSGTADHQGKALADSLRAGGYVVEELPRPFTITNTLLRSYDIVIRANGFGGYSIAEISAYRDFVEDGGRLLLLSDHYLYAPPDGVALGFGIQFAGITRGENRITAFTVHPITAEVTPLTYMVGSGIVAQPAAAQIVARLSDASYLDLNKNNVRDSTDITAPAVLGVLSVGSGRIVFSGDTNLWEQVPRPLLHNVLSWFKAP